jgi:hypothetical protein
LLGSEIGFQTLKTVADRSIPDVASNPNSQTAEKFRSDGEFGGKIVAVFSLQTGDDLGANLAGELARTLESGMPLFGFESNLSFVVLKNREVMPGLFID